MHHAGRVTLPEATPADAPLWVAALVLLLLAVALSLVAERVRQGVETGHRVAAQVCLVDDGSNRAQPAFLLARRGCDRTRRRATGRATNQGR